MQPRRLTCKQERFGPFSRLSQGSLGGCSARMFNGGLGFRPVFKQQPHSCRPASKVNCASCIETASCHPGSKPFGAAATVIAKAIESSVCNIYRGDTHIFVRRRGHDFVNGNCGSTRGQLDHLLDSEITGLRIVSSQATLSRVKVIDIANSIWGIRASAPLVESCILMCLEFH